MHTGPVLADKILKLTTSHYDRLRQVSEQEASIVTSDKWSPKQIIGHLIDSAFYNHIRFTRATLKDDLIFDGYPQVELVEVQQFQNRPWPELLSFWVEINNHLATVIRCFSDQQLNSPRVAHSLDSIAMKRVPAEQPATLAYLIEDYIEHMEVHLTQLYSRLP